MNLHYLMHRYGYIKDDTQYEQGMFGTIYPQFEGDVKGAIEHLKQVKEGECINVLNREDIGWVSLVWGKEGTESKAYTNGYGISHIIKVHEKELADIGYTIAQVIEKVFNEGELEYDDREKKIRLHTDQFEMTIKTQWDKIDKQLVLTAYDLRPVEEKNPERAELLHKNNKKGEY